MPVGAGGHAWTSDSTCSQDAVDAWDKDLDTAERMT